MSDEDRVALLAAEFRAEWAARAPQWEELAAGLCTPEEAAAAVATTQGAHGDADEIAAAQILFAPLDESFEARLVDRLHAMTQAHDRAAPNEGVVSIADARERSGWRRGAVAAAMVAMAAAAVVLINVWSTPPSAPETRGNTVVAQALPSYEGWIEGKAVVRAVGSAPLRAGQSLRVYLRPAKTVAGTVKVYLCLRRSDGTISLSAPTSEQPAGQTLSIEGTLPADLAAGPGEIVAVVDSGAGASIDCATMQAQPASPSSGVTSRVVVTLPVNIER